MGKLLQSDFEAAVRMDHVKPRGLRRTFDVLTQAGFLAVVVFRVGHWLSSRGLYPLARLAHLANVVLFGADIHPKARVGPGFEPIVVRDADVTVDEAVSTYLFNSQLVERPDGGLLLVAPAECREHPRVAAFLDELLARERSIAEVVTFDLRQSMRNGGGPACLRLRVPLTGDERSSIAANVFLDDALADALDAWIRRHYRERLAPPDLADPSLLDASRRALDELTQLLRLPGIYAFQRP